LLLSQLLWLHQILHSPSTAGTAAGLMEVVAVSTAVAVVSTVEAVAPLAVVVLTEAAGDIVGAARSGARALSAEEAIIGAEVFAVDQPRAALE
jgi:hypothetical protein